MALIQFSYYMVLEYCTPLNMLMLCYAARIQILLRPFICTSVFLYHDFLSFIFSLINNGMKFDNCVGKMTTLRKLLLIGNPLRTIRRCVAWLLSGVNVLLLIIQVGYLIFCIPPPAHWFLDLPLLYWSIFEVDFLKVKVRLFMSSIDMINNSFISLLAYLYCSSKRGLTAVWSRRCWSNYSTKKGCYCDGVTIIYQF